MGNLLELNGVSKFFGGLHAVEGIDLTLEEGGFLGLIGPNGAGKSTLLNVIAGYYPATSGKTFFKGQDITDWPNWKRARAGLARTYQSNRLLPTRTVAHHIQLAIQAAKNPSVGAAVRQAFRPYRDPTDEAVAALAPFGMEELLLEEAEALPHGHQRLLGIAMTVAACPVRPGLLLLDEPVTGMNDVEIEFTLDAVRRLRADGFTVIIVEHNMRALMRSVERVYVLDVGKKLAEGTPAEIASNPKVIDAYLGSALQGEET